VKGLNLILSICIGLSFGEVAKGWADIINGKFFCVANGANFICVVDVGSWCLFLLMFKKHVVTLNNLCNGLI
jgi:hypothetical protein